MRRIGVIHERKIDERRRKYHHLVDAGGIHIFEPRMGVSGTGVSADLFIPIFGSRLRGTDDFFGESGMPGFPRIFPLVGISKADLRISDQNQPVSVAVKMSLGEFLLVLWNVFVPDLGRFIDVAITIKDRKILSSAFSLVCHDYLL